MNVPDTGNASVSTKIVVGVFAGIVAFAVTSADPPFVRYSSNLVSYTHLTLPTTYSV